MRTGVLRWLTLCICSASAFDSHATEANMVQGVYESPYGKLLLSEKDGTVQGVSIDGGGPCKFKKGHVLLEGNRLDDNVTGSWNTCRVGRDCAEKKSGWVMLLVTKSGAVLSGAAHLELNPGCQAPVPSESLSLHRIAFTSTSAKPKPKTKPNAQPNSKEQTTREHVRAAPSAQSLALGRKKAEAIAAQAAVLLERGAIEAAREKFREAVAVAPHYSEGYVGIGVTYYMRDRYDEALDFYKKSLEANPGNRDAYYNTACVYALKGERDQALRYLKIAVLNGYISLETLNQDPDLKSLREEPEFKELAAGGI